MENVGKYSNDDLVALQAITLDRKIQITQTRILEYMLKLNGMVYVSFSGGKDSTVLLDMVRRINPQVPAVFADTGLEYPEIRRFVKSIDNVTFVKPKKQFKDIVSEYGYPIIGKEVAQQIESARHNPNSCKAQKLYGTLVLKDGEKYRKDNKKYAYLVDAPFKISDRCCYWMKKSPLDRYSKETGRHPITGMMAEESNLRRTAWKRHGCNVFEGRISSMPIAFWTEQDILHYVKRFDIPYCPIYGDIVSSEALRGQMRFDSIDYQDEKLITTGVSRSGCMYCMFGVHLEKHPNRFERMKITHPKQYSYCMKSLEHGGLGLSDVLDFINVKY